MFIKYEELELLEVEIRNFSIYCTLFALFQLTFNVKNENPKTFKNDKCHG